MKVGRIVLIKEHGDHNSIEPANLRHQTLLENQCVPSYHLQKTNANTAIRNKMPPGDVEIAVSPASHKSREGGFTPGRPVCYSDWFVPSRMRAEAHPQVGPVAAEIEKPKTLVY